MKRLIAICLVCVLLTAAASQGVTTAAPQEMTISFDENGNGSWTNGPDKGTLGYGSLGDETGIYSLTPPNQSTIVYGAVLIYEDATQTVLSDYLLFGSDTNPTNGSIYSYVYFYSEIEGTPLVAPGGYTNVVTMIEEGTEDGWNGVHYTPGVNDPGYMAQYDENGVTYNFTSDVPEPATIALLGLGALSLIRSRKRKT